MGFFNSLYTFVTFALTCTFLFFMGISYLVINFLRDTWINFLEKRFPDLEFVKKTSLRSVVDTHRNMGIITVLLTVKGCCDPFLIKKRFINKILEKKQNDGRYVYRHLRMTLTTRWGWYAWQKLVPFKVENHLVFADPSYRGRPISDSNIQDYVSDIVSKYLVPDLPPWQIIVFQHVSAEKYYLLIRVHHMLLNHEGLDLGVLLLLSKNKNAEDSGFIKYKKAQRSHPFQDLYKIPKALPMLYEQCSEALTNNWNEFLSVYDSLENPSILENAGLKSTGALFIIVTVSIMKQFINNSNLSRRMIVKEFKLRELNISLILRSLRNSLNPFSFVIGCIKVSCNVVVLLLVKLPMFLACELRSLSMINDDKYLDTSYIKAILAVSVLVKNAVKEVIYYWKLFFNGPRVIFDELIEADNRSRHQLQFLSLCGRKVVSWSEAVPLEVIQEIQDVTGASVSEILLSATSACLRDLLIQYSLDMPDSILVTARYCPQENLIQSQQRSVFSSSGSGILCLPLPIRNPFGVECDPVTELRAVQQVILRARLRQPALYLASLSQLEHGMLTQALPSPLLRLVFNMLSRRFPVTLSEVAPSELCDLKKRYLWGQEIEDIMYWRPPQANICMSLTLMNFGDYVRLGVMADALLSPNHTIVSSTFVQHICDLATAAGISNNFGNCSFASEDSVSSAGSHSSRNTTLSSSSLDFDLDSKNCSDDERNLNTEEPIHKQSSTKKLKFNIPSKKDSLS